jgi:exosortase/archaeosortase family protein
MARLIVPAAVRVTGPVFTIGTMSIQIVPDCTPMFPTLLLVGSMLAYPASWQRKATGIACGAALLWVYNMARIYVLMVVLRFAPAQFDIVHVYLWQTVTLLLVLGCFLLWVRISGASAAKS